MVEADFRIEVAGLVLVRQRPGTAKGVVFATLEDETGVVNVVIWEKVFKAYRKTILSARMLAVRGKVQSAHGVTHIVAEEMEDLTTHLLDLAHGKDFGERILARADEGKSGQDRPESRNRDALREIELARRRAYAALPGGRNFH